MNTASSKRIAAILLSVAWHSPAMATYSIAACDGETGRCGVAVATHNLAVGSSVPFAEAGVGAGVSQFETNPLHAPEMLNVLRAGGGARDALAAALAVDAQFGDGQDKSFRQIAVVSIDGKAAVHTGANAGSWAGHLASDYVTVQGNGLTSQEVLKAMLTAFETSRSRLADRLVIALEAGYAVGGQTIGVKSSAVLVSTSQGWPMDVDLRVDSSPTAVADLRRLLNERLAFDSLIRARNAHWRGDAVAAAAYANEALRLAPAWDRLWLRAARLARAWNNADAERACLCRFRRLNPVWAAELELALDPSRCPDAGEGADRISDPVFVVREVVEGDEA